MTLTERVAKAICKSRTCEGIYCCQWPAQGGRQSCRRAARIASAAISPSFDNTGGGK